MVCVYLLAVIYYGGGGGGGGVGSGGERFLILLYFIIMASVLGMQVYGMHLLDGVGLIELLACRNE